MTAPHSNSIPSSDDNNEWQPSTGHELADLSRNLRQRRTRRTFLRVSGAASGMLLLGGGFWLLRQTSDDAAMPHFGGLSCEQVASRISDYIQERLSAIEVAQMEQHIAQCPRCQELLNAMRPRA